MNWNRVPYKELSFYLVSSVVSNGFQLTVENNWKLLTWRRMDWSRQAVQVEYDDKENKWWMVWLDSGVNGVREELKLGKLVFVVQGMIDHLVYVK